MNQVMTTRRTVLGAGLVAGWGSMAAGGLLSGCAANGAGAGWNVLFDGASSTDLVGWTPLGEGNWRVTDGTIEGRNGKAGFLVSADSYRDFEIESEFWADADCNSGIFIRCQDRNNIRCGQGRAAVSAGGQPLEHLPHLCARRLAAGGVQRADHRRCARRAPARRPDRAAVGRRHGALSHREGTQARLRLR
ncbi:MAG: DUF1080 domain-containing protein [Betaproteobacteria bacterium]|nr:DUF1080 domain-containing protein [Betaproteobacteria bacterium]